MYSGDYIDRSSYCSSFILIFLRSPYYCNKLSFGATVLYPIQQFNTTRHTIHSVLFTFQYTLIISSCSVIVPCPVLSFPLKMLCFTFLSLTRSIILLVLKYTAIILWYKYASKTCYQYSLCLSLSLSLSYRIMDISQVIYNIFFVWWSNWDIVCVRSWVIATLFN